MSSALSRSASAKTMFGFLPPSSSAIFFTVPDAAAMIRLPVARPPVKETRSTLGSSLSGAPAFGPSPTTRFATPAGTPGLGEQLHQVDGRVRGELARLQDERAARRERRRDLPRDLQQRVVPGRDQPAHTDGFVHHPADHVVAPGVDDPTRFRVCHQAEVVEHAGDVVDVDLALDQALAGVERLHPRHLGLVALEQLGDPEQDVTSLACAAWRPTDRCRRRLGQLRSRTRCRRRWTRRSRRPARSSQGSESPGVRPAGQPPILRR